MSSITFKTAIHLPLLRSPFIILIDGIVLARYKNSLDDIEKNPYHLKTISLTSGEKCKSLKSLNAIFKTMNKLSCPKNTVVIAIGGGTILDLSGLIASLWMRGISWYSIPTTLLAQVDSCFGGKTAINFENRKNLIGTIYPAQKIYIFHEFIKNLPIQLHLDGASEIFKHALLTNDSKLVNSIAILITNKNPLSQHIIKKSLAIKKSIIGSDLHEKNKARIKLNFGHTLGHALEELFPKVFNHGRAIWWGLKLELLLHDNVKHYHTEIQIVNLALESHPDFAKELKLITKNVSKIVIQAVQDKKNTNTHELTLIQISKTREAKICHLPITYVTSKLQKEIPKL